MLLKRKAALPLVLASGLVAAMAIAGVSIASHPHPANGGADKLTFPMVPAFKPATPCAGTTTTHGAPLGAASCVPPVATSPHITTGTATTFKGRSSFVIDVTCTNAQTPPCPAPGDQEDVKLTATSTDIRCKAGPIAVGVCGNENGAPAGKVGDDYTGEVQGDATIRITDAYNRPPGFTSHGTVLDLPFPVKGTCSNTTNATIGATCGVSTSADAVVPTVVKEGKKANVEIGQVHVNDGGSDGDVQTAAGNTLFAVQGIYIP